jgi:sensor domain CHASE-containing protein
MLSRYAVSAANGNAGAYKAATGVSLTIAVVMLLALVFVIISVYFWRKYRGIGEETLSIENNMHSIHNRIHI